MGKLSVSIPDELEAKLRQYSDEHDLPVSQAVTKALELLLETSTPPLPPGSDLRQVQHYLSAVAMSVEAIRRLLEASGLTGLPWPGGPTLPPPLPYPPWALPSSSTHEKPNSSS